MADSSTAFAVGTIATGFGSGKPPSDNGAGTTDIGVYRNRRCWAINGASSALHAKILVHDLRFASSHRQYPVRTNDGAYAAPDALFGIEKKCRGIFQVNVFHDNSLYHKALRQDQYDSGYC